MTIASTIERGGVYVVAELGANHGGSIDTAKRMIDACAWAGASAVKTQKRDISTMDPAVIDQPYTGPHSYGATYREHRAALELTIDQHAELAEYARARGLGFGCSAWDLRSAAEIAAARFDFIKVPSALSADDGLLAAISTYAMPVVVSWGMSEWHDVEAGTDALTGAEVYGLQCSSAYPLGADDVHLQVIPSMHAQYVVTRRWKAVGFSDHTPGIALSSAAVAVGARVIERHVTLDRHGKGTDHAASLEPDALQRVVRDCAAVMRAMGSADKRVLDAERGAMRKLRPARLWR